MFGRAVDPAEVAAQGAPLLYAYFASYSFAHSFSVKPGVRNRLDGDDLKLSVNRIEVGSNAVPFRPDNASPLVVGGAERVLHLAQAGA
jgi:hypothetical protein